MIPENAIKLENDIYSVFVEKYGKRYFLSNASSYEEARKKYLDYMNEEEIEE